MRIEFSDNVPTDGAFALFNYSELLAKRAGFIDIRGLVQTHEESWLDDLAASHGALFTRLSRINKWVWTSAASRLDARPWGQEDLIKPLFFSAAVLHWLDDNPHVTHVTLVSCPIDVADYLLDMRPDLDIAGTPRQALAAVGIKRGLVRNVANALRYHAMRSFAGVSDMGANLVAYESLYGASLLDGHRYYFTSQLDGVGERDLSFLATGVVPLSARGMGQAQGPMRFAVNDGCSIFDILRGVQLDLRAHSLIKKVARSAPECTIGDMSTKIFWQRFLNAMAGHDVFNAYMAYRGTARLMASGRVKRLVFPYEEKGIERALMFAAAEAGVQTLGVTPHPQHPLAVSMRDRKDSNCPKPDAYAVCGPAYKPFFREWGNKTKQPIDIWGSQKGTPSTEVAAYGNASGRPKVLLVLSHPHELRVFKSWLESESDLYAKADITLRRYLAVDVSVFENELAAIQKHFPNVAEVHGTLAENVADCDVVLFCGTSAGPEAVQLGRVGVYAGLNDFFVMNPCFNDLSDMLPCMTAADLVSFLDTWRTMTADNRQAMLTKQRTAVKKLFAPINRDTIQKTLS